MIDLLEERIKQLEIRVTQLEAKGALLKSAEVKRIADLIERAKKAFPEAFGEESKLPDILEAVRRIADNY